MAALSRRGLLGGIAAAPLLTLPAVASEPCPDAALLAWGSILEQMTARRDALYPAMGDTEAAALAAVGPAPPAFTPEAKAWGERLAAEERANGHMAARAVYEAADGSLLRALGEVCDVPAGTLAGLIFKARLAERHEYDALGDSIVGDLLRVGGSA